jgi:hypothetical protein
VRKLLLFAGIIAILSASMLIARSFRESEIPNGPVYRCANCHINPSGGGARNAFGQEVERNHLTTSGAGGHVRWGADLANKDSDGDGFTNGQELQDPSGSWIGGSPAPGNSKLVSNPGDPTSFPLTSPVEKLDAIVRSSVLLGNYPNPFNPTTTVRFDLGQAGPTRVRIFDMLGHQIRTLIRGNLTPGAYSVPWDGRDENGALVTTGIYFCTLEGTNVMQVRRMILAK